MKFKKNDKVWFHDQKAEVTAVVMEAAKSYAVAYKTPKGVIRHTTTVEGQLEMRKGKKDLEKGDQVTDSKGRLVSIRERTTFNGVLVYKIVPIFIPTNGGEIEYLTPDYIEEIVRDGKRGTPKEECY